MSKGCFSTTVHMDGTDHAVDVYCVGPGGLPPVPEPCCWAIYAVDWWALPKTPVDPVDEENYYAMHCVEWLPEGHTEIVGPFTIVIPDPSWEQVTSFYDAAWNEVWPVRENPLFGPVQLVGMERYSSSINIVEWKSIVSVAPMLAIHSWSLGIVPIDGNPGWPFAVGNSWMSVGMSVISTPSTSYYVATAAETITVPLFPGGIECIRVEGYSWVDADGIDNDGDAATDEDPLNYYDDDGDGQTDEDGGDGVPQAGELTPSSIRWWNNAYGVPIREWNLPGGLFNGYEYRDLIWYCFDPPFPPWQ